MRNKIFFCYIIGFCSCLFTGCSSSSKDVIVLWTNRAEFVAYSEAFNAAQKNYKLEIKYKDDPVKAISGKDNIQPDLVIGEDLACREDFDKFDSLNDILGDKKVNPAHFYKNLISLGTHNGAHKFLPINFNLPAIIYKPTNLQKPVNGLIISLDEIKENSKTFRSDKGKQLNKLGFSPLWNELFIYHTALLLGTELKIDKNGTVSCDGKSITEASLFLKDWLKGSNGQLQEEIGLAEEFKKKYMTTPEYQLLHSDRILFSFEDIRDFLKAPPEKVENLDFRWLAYNNKIPVLDDILFAGVHSKGRNKQGAKEFLIWFFQLDTQIHLLETNHLKRLRGIFGLANGFSALKEINEKELHKPQKYPLFVEHVPQEEQLLFPLYLIKEGKAFKTAFVKELVASMSQQKQEFKMVWPPVP